MNGVVKSVPSLWFIKNRRWLGSFNEGKVTIGGSATAKGTFKVTWWSRLSNEFSRVYTYHSQGRQGI